MNICEFEKLQVKSYKTLGKEYSSIRHWCEFLHTNICELFETEKIGDKVFAYRRLKDGLDFLEKEIRKELEELKNKQV